MVQRIGIIRRADPLRGTVNRQTTSHPGRVNNQGMARGTVHRQATTHTGKARTTPRVLGTVHRASTTHAGRVWATNRVLGVVHVIAVTYQRATARIANTYSLTQSAVGRISNTYTKTQAVISRILNTSVTKTQHAVASIVVARRPFSARGRGSSGTIQGSGSSLEIRKRR